MRFERLKFNRAMPGTKKLFLEDPYRSKATGKVIEIQGVFVVLEQSLFYPESGGQTWDRGTIDGIPVVEVQDQGGNQLFVTHPTVAVAPVTVKTVIVHQLARAPEFKVGDVVDLQLDWDYRYQVMRQHSASHFLFHAAKIVYGQDRDLYVKGCSIRDDGHRFDYADSFDRDLVSKVEEIANELILRGQPIDMVPEPRSKEIFYWTYSDDIIIPCGGTHVRSAGELGQISVKCKSKGSNLTRLSGEFV